MTGGEGRNIRGFCEVENKYTTQGGAVENVRIFHNPAHRCEVENKYTTQGGAVENARIFHNPAHVDTSTWLFSDLRCYIVRATSDI